jgi:uncharacterized protein YcfL
MRNIIFLILAVFILSGCSEKAAPAKGPTLVEQLAGTDAIRQGQAAKVKIDAINKAAKERNADADME